MSSREKQVAVKLWKYLHVPQKSGLIVFCLSLLSVSLCDFDRDIKVETQPSLTFDCHTSHLNQIFIKSYVRDYVFCHTEHLSTYI